MSYKLAGRRTTTVSSGLFVLTMGVVVVVVVVGVGVGSVGGVWWLDTTELMLFASVVLVLVSIY